MADTDSIKTLNEGIQLLKDDRTNGARVLATNALWTLRAITLDSNDDVATPEKLWDLLRIAGYKLILARPSMNAAITSAVVTGLQAVRECTFDKAHEQLYSPAFLRQSVAEAFSEQIKKRNESKSQLAKALVGYFHDLGTKEHRIRILTLSSSSTIFACLEQVVDEFPEIPMTLIVLESRPRMEGATFAVSFLDRVKTGGKGSNIDVIIAPESHVCALAKTTDVLLLGADRISTAGDISNKMGSFCAAMAVRTLSRGEVVIVTETDKIARSAPAEEHGDENNDPEEVFSKWPENTVALMRSLPQEDISICNIYFEWVPREYVSLYVTEVGVLNADTIRQTSEEKGKIEDELFSSSIRMVALLE